MNLRITVCPNPVLGVRGKRATELAIQDESLELLLKLLWCAKEYTSRPVNDLAGIGACALSQCD